MFSSRDIIPPSRQACYFSITPGQASQHGSVETPLCSPELQNLDNPVADPSNPLLAVTLSPPPILRLNSRKMVSDGSNLFQLQSRAAHQPERRTRPQPQPVQSTSILGADDDLSSSDLASPRSGADSLVPSAASSDCSDCPSTRSSPQSFSARCSRCHSHSTTNVQTRKTNMVAYGLNLYYCTRCADITGLGRRR